MLLVIHNISPPPGEFGGPWIDRLLTVNLPLDAHPYFADIAHLQMAAYCLIRRDGKIVQYVSFDQRAWHAEVSCYQGRENCNDFSIDIELEGTSGLPYTDAQYQALAAVTQLLLQHYTITPSRITGDSDIAPTRKSDPGHAFDWEQYQRLLAQTSFLFLGVVMTLFSLLLVLGWERLFELGEHWQLAYRLEPLFRRRRRFSLLHTLAMEITAMVIWSLKGVLFSVAQLTM